MSRARDPIDQSTERGGQRRTAARWSRLASVVSASALAAGALPGPAAASTTPPDVSGNYAFTTVNDQKDPTFNQLLGINNSGVIAGYFGSGQTGHPNKGFVVSPGYSQAQFKSENVPGAAQTQVVGIDNAGVTVGFWVGQNGANHGFYAVNRKHFHTADFPAGSSAKPPVDQLLAVNDTGLAVGFYTDAKGVNHGYSYSIRSHRYHSITISGDTNVTVAGVNNLNDVAGFATNSAGGSEGFLRRSDGKLFRLNFPGASATQAFGVNNGDEVVGDYTDGSGNSATTHGFIWAPGFGFQTVNDPNGTDSTILNGVNDRGSVVGFYTDSAGNTDGLVAKATP